MLQRIRDGLQGQKWLAWVVLGAIGLTFVFWGGSGALDFTGMATRSAAKVDGEEIPATEATKAWSDTQMRWSQQFGTEIPDDQRARIQDNILDNLVLQKLLQLRLEDEFYRVSDGRVLGEFQNVPAFKGPDGKFDPTIARQLLQANGITEQEYFRDTRSQLLMNQLQQGIGSSYFLTSAEAKRLFELENEEREVAYVQFKPDQFIGAETVDDAAIQAYYDKNGDRFMSAESVSLEYAELRLEQIASQVVPTEADLRKLYDDNRANFVLEERRRARHILIPVSGDDDAGALKQAESVLAEARAGKDFAELAKKYSTDSTAADGGELGFIQQKDFPGPFGDTLFGMKLGDIAGPVKSQFGYHLIKLEEIQAGEAKPFESVRAELDSQYRQEHSAELFGDRQEQISALLEKGENDLDKVAQSLGGLTRGSIAEFLRGGGAEPLGSSPDLQQVVFDDSTLNQGKIGGPVALGEDRLVIVKVTGHRKSEIKPLAQVRDEIVTLLKEERGVAAAKAAAEALLPKLEAGEKLDALAAAHKLTVEPARFVSRGDPSIPAALRTAVFEAPRPAGKPVMKSATLDDGATVVFVVTNTRQAASPNPQLVQQQNAMLSQRAGAGDVAAYVNEAKRKAKIVKNPAVFE
jgi:peptidyl-prolyl cis-trans isomerase D